MSHAAPCHPTPRCPTPHRAVPRPGTRPSHGTRVPRTLGSAVDTSSAGARSPPEHPPGPSTPHSPDPVRRRAPARVPLATPCTLHRLFVSTFPGCHSIRQASCSLIQWCLIFDFLKYHKWMGRQCAGDALYMSSNTYLNI